MKHNMETTMPASLGLAYETNGNNIDVISKTRRKATPIQMLLGLKRGLKAEGFTAIKSDYGKGYEVSRPQYQWTIFTIYLDGDENRFTLYDALPDIRKGIDIEDERLNAKGLTVHQAITRMIDAEKSWGFTGYVERVACP